ncbi:hypothetical protein BDW68DRAFT_156281 [Aspergillus falconensis]
MPIPGGDGTIPARSQARHLQLSSPHPGAGARSPEDRGGSPTESFYPAAAQF